MSDKIGKPCPSSSRSPINIPIPMVTQSTVIHSCVTLCGSLDQQLMRSALARPSGEPVRLEALSVDDEGDVGQRVAQDELRPLRVSLLVPADSALVEGDGQGTVKSGIFPHSH